MQNLRTKNIRLLFYGKIIYCCILLLFTGQLQSQVVEDSVTVQQQDTTITEKKVFFLQRWESGGDEFILQQRKLPDSVVKKLQSDDKFWYANAIFEKKKQPGSLNNMYVPLGQRVWFKTLIWIIIIGGFAVFLMIYLKSMNVGLFSKRNVLAKGDEEEIIPEDIFAINYKKEIDIATMQGNYRQAVRFMYLKLLKNMSEKNIINYKQDKTNLDYLSELYSTAYYKDFFRLTRNFEYCWYGQFKINATAYKIISDDFNQFDRRINQ